MPTRELLNLRPVASFSRGFWIRLAVALAANAPSLLAFGLREPPASLRILALSQIAVLGVYLLFATVRLWRSPDAESRAEVIDRFGRIELVACVLALFVIAFPQAVALCAAAFLAARLVRFLLLLIEKGVSPPLVLVGGFATVILAGAGMLMLPASTPPGQRLNFVDALFTSTSATCVTGLVVVDTPTAFTRFGHTVILVLMQLGGLGLLAFASVLILAVGASLGLRATSTLSDSSLENRHGPRGIRKVLASIVIFTFGFEAIGAAMLFFGWPETWPNAPDMSTFGDRLFHSVFFSVSAFCNAGFATTPDSVESLRLHWTTHTAIAGLVVVGGLGFPALDNVRQVVTARLRRKRVKGGRLVRLALHTKLTLVTTFVVYVIGAITIFVSEYVQTLEDPGVALLDAHFMAIASRTAGFDTIHPAELGPLARFTLTVQMFIGGGPASTAGGVKTVATAVLFLTVVATLRGRDATEAFKRTIPDALVRKAAVLITLGLATLAALVAFLSVTEVRADGTGPSLEEILFESVSATATVGLSMGITPTLTDPGKIAVAFAMFLGRLGPLAVLGALASVRKSERASYAYPSEGVLMT